VNKKERRRAIEWLRSYRSPIAETVKHEDLSGGWSIWSNQGIAVVIETPKPDWPDDVARWYIARRDANLIGSCPCCNAVMPPVVARVAGQQGAMVHDYGCIVGDGAFREVFGDKIK
jgi:hypothetical protein